MFELCNLGINCAADLECGGNPHEPCNHILRRDERQYGDARINNDTARLPNGERKERSMNASLQLHHVILSLLETKAESQRARSAGK